MKEELKHKIGLVVVIASLLGVCTMPMGIADDETEIICNVTAGVYTVTIEPMSINYGSLPAGGYNSSGTINATNAGAVTIDLLVRGANAFQTPPGTGQWILSNTPGSDQYRHTFTPAAGTETNLTTSNQLLKDDLAAGLSQEFTLTIYVPTTIANPGDYSTEVTVTATGP